MPGRLVYPTQRPVDKFSRPATPDGLVEKAMDPAAHKLTLLLDIAKSDPGLKTFQSPRSCMPVPVARPVGSGRLDLHQVR